MRKALRAAPSRIAEFSGGRGVKAKKAKGKGKATAKKPAAKRSSSKAKKGKDIVEVRENINELVKDSAEDIASSVIEVATRTGQLASAKYLFEAVGIYPATEQTDRPIETTMAHQLLTRLGLPLEPVVCDEDATPAATSPARGDASDLADVADEDGSEERHVDKPLPVKSEE
jgi:hypothetical protein